MSRGERKAMTRRDSRPNRGREPLNPPINPHQSLKPPKHENPSRQATKP